MILGVLSSGSACPTCSDLNATYPQSVQSPESRRNPSRAAHRSRTHIAEYALAAGGRLTLFEHVERAEGIRVANHGTSRKHFRSSPVPSKRVALLPISPLKSLIRSAWRKMTTPIDSWWQLGLSLISPSSTTCCELRVPLLRRPGFLTLTDAPQAPYIPSQKNVQSCRFPQPVSPGILTPHISYF